MPKKMIGLSFVALAMLTVSGNVANAQVTQDDLRWVNQCIRDNEAEAGGTPAIVRAYCICMNEKMGDNETRSITQWERANPGARRDCERQSGWR